jgi:hypothetical protein
VEGTKIKFTTYHVRRNDPVGKKTPLTFCHMMEEQPNGKIKPLINEEDIM